MFPQFCDNIRDTTLRVVTLTEFSTKVQKMILKLNKYVFKINGLFY